MPAPRVIVANRGEIAVRVIRACHELGMYAIAVHSDADADAVHVRMADEAVRIGPASASKSYLSIDAILEAARATSADAVHPGYGFLSENARFARAIQNAGLTWVGPSPEVIDLMGDKASARAAAERAGVPVVPGTGVLADADAARAAAADMGYPVLLKASAGGGGRGIRRIDDDSALTESFLQAQREVTAAFGDGSMYLERSLENVRHVEVQVLSDGRGRTIHLFERECSMQRRRQKVIEETPAPGLPTDVRQRMCSAAVDLAASVGYASAGTVEFLVEPNDEFSFIEMNTRIQVEHGITEMLTGIDLVQWQLRVAFGEDLGLEQSDVQPRGAVIEVRLNAEDPRNSFMGSPGTLTLCRFPAGPGVRVDSGFEQGAEVQPFYDSMIAKVMAHAPSRPEAIRRARRALDETKIEGVTTTIDFTRTLLESEAFISGNYTTATLENLLEA